MGERIAAEIDVGGKIPERKLPKLLDAIWRDGARLDWGEAGPKCVEEMLDCRKGDCLWFCDEEAWYGTFPNLERYCQENTLAYNRTSEAKYEYDRTLEFVRHPHGKKIQIGSVVVDSDQKPLVPESSLRKILAQMETDGQDTTRRLQKLASAIKALRALLDVPPPLPPFEIVNNIWQKPTRRGLTHPT